VPGGTYCTDGADKWRLFGEPTFPGGLGRPKDARQGKGWEAYNARKT
jgi:hypothetical protein